MLTDGEGTERAAYMILRNQGSPAGNSPCCTCHRFDARTASCAHDPGPAFCVRPKGMLPPLPEWGASLSHGPQPTICLGLRLTFRPL
jgi:hypothetical protein